MPQSLKYFFSTIFPFTSQTGYNPTKVSQSIPKARAAIGYHSSLVLVMTELLYLLMQVTSKTLIKNIHHKHSSTTFIKNIHQKHFIKNIHRKHASKTFTKNIHPKHSSKTFTKNIHLKHSSKSSDCQHFLFGCIISCTPEPWHFSSGSPFFLFFPNKTSALGEVQCDMSS